MSAEHARGLDLRADDDASYDRLIEVDLTFPRAPAERSRLTGHLPRGRPCAHRRAAIDLERPHRLVHQLQLRGHRPGRVRCAGGGGAWAPRADRAARHPGIGAGAGNHRARRPPRGSRGRSARRSSRTRAGPASGSGTAPSKDRTRSSRATTATSRSATTAPRRPRPSSPHRRPSSPSRWQGRSTSTRGRIRSMANLCRRRRATPFPGVASPTARSRSHPRGRPRSCSTRRATGCSASPRSLRGTGATTSTARCS